MSRLVLLPDDPDPLDDYTTDDGDDGSDDDDEEPIPISQLSNSVVFLYLLSPYLRLGAIYASDLARARAVVALLVAASLSTFCRQIWFLLGRYLRKSSTEDILVHAFARRRPGVRRLGLARYIVTIVSASFRLLLAAMYLKDSVASVLLLDLPEFLPSRSRLNVSVVLSILVFVLSLPRSLASKSVRYTTGLSIASYLAWLLALCSTHTLALPSSGSRLLWNEISSFVFACTTSMTVPLSASLMAGAPQLPASRNSKTRPFQLLNMSSAMLAALLMMPVAALPRAPEASTVLSDNIVLGFRIATLVLSIPSVVVSITLLPLHGATHRFIRTDLALSLITLVIFALALLPPAVGCVLDDVTMFLAVFGTFLLPALTHIAIHYFRRPLSIVMPQAPSSVSETPRTSHLERSLSPSRDPLLQRKERLLQRRRLGKRLLWDIVVFIVLVPICICALVWATGRLARRW